MIRIKRFLSIFFVLAWVAGEAPRLWWKEILSIRPMDVAAVLLVMLDITGRIRGIRRTRGGRAIPVIAGVLAASWILGLRLWLVGEATVGLLYLMRTLVYFWLIWRAKEIFMGVRRWVPAAMAATRAGRSGVNVIAAGDEVMGGVIVTFPACWISASELQLIGNFGTNMR